MTKIKEIKMKMFALVQKHDGYSGTSEGPSILSCEPWLEPVTIDVPKLQEGQVLIKIAMASVNPSDLHFIKGEYGQPRVKGSPAGFEGIGEVIDGNGSYAQSLIGTRVSFVVAKGGSGTWAEYAITDAVGCIPVLPNLRNEDGAALIVNPLTAMAMFELVKKTESKSFIMTASNSQLCKLLIGLGKDADISPICIVRDAKQGDHLRQLGATEVLDSTDTDFTKNLRAIVKNLKPRVMLDALANQLSADIFMAMPNRSRWIVYGKLDTTPPVIPEMGQFVFSEKVIEGFWLVKWFRETEIAEQMQVIKAVQERFVSGNWKTEVSEVLKLHEVMTGLTTALKTDAKVMFTPK